MRGRMRCTRIITFHSKLSISCTRRLAAAFPRFLCVFVFCHCQAASLRFVLLPATGRFCAAVHLFALVGLLFCSATLLFVFYFYWSISFPSSLFTMFRFLFQSPTKEPVVWFICLLIGLFRIDFGIGGPLAFAATFSPEVQRVHPESEWDLFSLFALVFLFFSSFFTSPSHMCLLYVEAFFHPFHVVKVSSWRLFLGGLSFRWFWKECFSRYIKASGLTLFSAERTHSWAPHTLGPTQLGRKG